MVNFQDLVDIGTKKIIFMRAFGKMARNTVGVLKFVIQVENIVSFLTFDFYIQFVFQLFFY